MGEDAHSGKRVVARRGVVSSMLFAFLRPRDAGRSTLDGSTVRLRLPTGSRDIAVGEIEEVELHRQWCWSSVRIRTASGNAAVSGLAAGDASALADALDAARRSWWAHAVGAHANDLRAIAVRLAALRRPDGYVRHRAFARLRAEVEAVAARFPGRHPDGLPASAELDALETARRFLGDPGAARQAANDAFLDGELKRARVFCDRVESRPLSAEQRHAVVVDDDRNLVTAGAGSGKTSVLVAKAGWLLETGARRPRELLLLAFARNAREELAERVASRLGNAARDVDVRTFHELGLAIIGEAEGGRPTLARVAEDPAALFDVLKGIIGEMLDDPRHAAALVHWLSHGSAPYRSAHAFETQGAYWDYVRSQEIRSLQGELVKSFEECRIANFLYMNGIAYAYERVYEHDTATATKSQYRPDFHLLDSGIYIEHFALSASGRTPPFIDQEAYAASMAWKRDLHARHGTTLVETFSHEQRAGTLLAGLADKLREHGVVGRPIPARKVFAVLEEQGRVASFTRLAATFLRHFKGSRLTIDAVVRRAADTDHPGRARAFLRVFGAILERYEARLARAGEIDFHDMVNLATDHVVAGRYESPYGYVLVDEFQDISRDRAALLKALLGQSDDAQLFAVGDDWQAVYRFAGADVGVMGGFEGEFGPGARTSLATTFRCSEGVSAVATRFVLDNPGQLRRRVRALRDVEGPCVWIGLGGDDGGPLIDQALGRIAADSWAAGRPDVRLLGRYRHQRPDLARLRRDHRALDLAYSTVHAAKGLEADYVVVLGLSAGRYGFPSEMEDDPLLDLVLATPESHPNAEERRLLHVALTRARRRVYLLAGEGEPSAFVKELLGQEGVGTFGRPTADDVACRACGTGRMVRRTGGAGRPFFGCSNYPYCDRTEEPCPRCGVALPVRGEDTFHCRGCGAALPGCPVCDGMLRERRGRYGRFLGCSNYPACRYTRDGGRLET